MCIQYVNLITKIPECNILKFGEEESVEGVTKIGEAVLTTMRYEVIYRKVIEKTYSEKKIKVNALEAPVDLKYFIYIIHQLPSAE